MNLNNNIPSKPVIQNEEIADIKKHSGELWECIGKRKALYGGYIYEFIAEEKFDNFSPNPDLISRIENVAKKTREIYPAIEQPPEGLWQFCENPEVKNIEISEAVSKLIGNARIANTGQSEQEIRDLVKQTPLEIIVNSLWDLFKDRRKILKEAGYQVVMDKNSRLHLELPDLEALQNGWEHVRETHPELQLPDLDVVESEGIADDLAYAKAYQEHDVLLSTGKEFVHDHTVHVMTRIFRMLKGKEDYEAEKERITTIIKNLQSTIEEAVKREEPDGILHKEKEKLDFLVGMFTDVFFSFGEDGQILIATQETIESSLSGEYETDHVWDDYLEKRFGPGTTFDTLVDLWKEVRRLVPLEEKPLS